MIILIINTLVSFYTDQATRGKDVIEILLSLSIQQVSGMSALPTNQEMSQEHSCLSIQQA